MDIYQLQITAAVLLVMLCGTFAAMRFVIWSHYVAVREERDLLAVRCEALQQDRDGWREVAQRALLIAQMGRAMSRRASTLAVKAVE